MDVERVYGVDFSASKRDAGRNTWITEGTPGDGPRGLTIESCRCAADALDTKPARDEVLPALAEFVRTREPGSVIGLDFPFSLPRELTEAEDWHTFVGNFPPGDVDSPDELSRWAKQDGHQPSRDVDESHSAKPPAHWLIKTQTFYGIRDVLGAIHDAEAVSILPFDEPDAEDVGICEIYPAATLAAIDGHRTGYTHVTEESWRKRTENVEAMERRGVRLDDETRLRARANDDALDSIVAAFATWQNARDGFEAPAADPLEGYIYV